MISSLGWALSEADESAAGSCIQVTQVFHAPAPAQRDAAAVDLRIAERFPVEPQAFRRRSNKFRQK